MQIDVTGPPCLATCFIIKIRLPRLVPCLYPGAIRVRGTSLAVMIVIVAVGADEVRDVARAARQRLRPCHRRSTAVLLRVWMRTALM